MSRTISQALGAVLFIAGLCMSPTIGFSYSQLSVTADPIKNDPGPGTPLTFSDNGLHVAWIGAAGSRYTAYVDGDAGNTYDEISPFTGFRPARQFIFSPDGSRAAYLARSGQNRLLIVGGQEFPLRAQSSDISDFCFSPDGKQFAYAVTPANGDAFVVLNGKEQAHTATILQMQFSSNSAHFAYVASTTLVPLLQRNGNQTVPPNATVVLDGISGPEFYTLGAITFSSDANHIGYIGVVSTANPGAASNGDYRLMIDRKEFAKHDLISSFQFTQNGQHVMYTAGKVVKRDMYGRPIYDQYACLDGQEWPYLAKAFPEPSPAPQLSPDGKRIAYVEAASTDGSTNTAVVAVNGVRGPEYENIIHINFSPDGQHLCYVAAQTALPGSSPRYFVIYDGVESGPYQILPGSGDFALIPTFSSDGQHFAYEAGDGTHRFVVADGKRGPDYDSNPGPLVYSPDNKRLAYPVIRDRLKNLTPAARQQAMVAPYFDFGRYIVLNGMEQHLPLRKDFVHGVIRFSPDSQHIAYLVASELYVACSGVAVDGRVVKLPAIAVKAPTDDELMTFSPNSKHLIYTQNLPDLSAKFVTIDGDIISDYAMACNQIAITGNKVEYLGHKRGPKNELERVFVNMGPDRDYGTIGPATINAAPPPNTPR